MKIENGTLIVQGKTTDFLSNNGFYIIQCAHMCYKKIEREKGGEACLGTRAEAEGMAKKT